MFFALEAPALWLNNFIEIVIYIPSDSLLLRVQFNSF